jgi:putative nucleotidyltransferase with HDIG domain
MNTNRNDSSLIHKALQSVPLPPRAVQELLRLSHEADVDMQRIVDTITSDEALTARVIRVVNSALFGLERRVTSVQQATVLLGKEAITQIAVGVAALHMETSTSSDLPLSRQSFWRHSMGTAFLARELGRTMPDVDGEEAFTAGLLHDIGKLVLMGYLGPEYSHVLEQAANDQRPLHHVEREMLGVDHDDIGRELCNRWKLSGSFQSALSVHEDDEANGLKRIVQTANAAAKAAQVGQSGNAFIALDRLALREMRQVAQNWTFIQDVPEEVVEIERVFRLNADADQSEADMPLVQGAGETVLVHVDDAKLAALLMMTLAGAGYRPQPVAPNGAASAADAEPGVGLTDKDRPPRDGRTWLNVTAWRAEHHRGADHNAIDVEALRSWLVTTIGTRKTEGA